MARKKLPPREFRVTLYTAHPADRPVRLYCSSMIAITDPKDGLIWCFARRRPGGGGLEWKRNGSRWEAFVPASAAPTVVLEGPTALHPLRGSQEQRRQAVREAEKWAREG